MMLSRGTVTDNEEERVKALNTYDILDTLPEAEFDAITRLASYICNVPYASISFIDDDRQWFKSAVGMPLGQVPRNETFCQYTIMDDQLLEVPDTTQSDIFHDHINVIGGFGVRFYAGAPLIDPEGHCIGTLCVFDQKPKDLTAEQREALRTLASEVISHLTLRKQKKELERSLQLHKDFYTLFNSSSEIHYIADETSKIELINNAVKTILGYEPQKLIGHSLWEFVVEHDRDQFATLIETGLRTKKAFTLETCVVASNQQEKCISWTAVNRDGKWFASGRDITEQKAAQEKIEQLSLVASKISNGVAITDAHNRVIWINKAFETITGYDLMDMQGNQLGEILRGDYNDPGVSNKVQDMLRSQKPFDIELHVQNKNDDHMWLSVTNSPVVDSDGVTEKFIKVISDITARKAAEKDVEILSFASAKSPSGLVIRDRESRIIWMNETAEQILGYELDELKGRVFGDKLIGEYTDRDVLQKAKEAYDGNRSYEIEIQIYRKDGTPRWVFLSNSPFFNETGQLERQVTVCMDITDRKLAEEQVRMLSLVASNTTSGVVINDAEGNVEWVNKAFEKITGYTLASVQGTHLGDVLRGEDTDGSIIERARQLSKNKQSFEVDLLVYRRDGQPLWISVINSVILDELGRVKKYIEVVIDITARKKAEIELINAKEEALQLSRAKEMFISVMSHEIRTPLNAVIGMSHLLAEENASESQKENLEVLKFSAENLMTLINDVLDLTKIETGNIELEKTRVDLRELTKSVVNSMQFNLSGSKNIYLKQHVDEEIPQYVLGDRTRLIQILLNLASNAVKFTETGGVTIDLKIIEQSAAEVRIRFAVTDTGIGIPADKVNTIFESFKQASTDTTRKYGGTGLGLAISKRLIELHDSRINVDSVVDQGSTFWFTITFKKDNNNTMTSAETAEIGLKVNVLVVDDNQINRLLINKVLKKWGIQADFAENGLEAIQKVTTNMNYDVVLMDIHMPEMGGLEATQVLRGKSDDYFKKLPIIALTASMLNNQLNQIEESGMNDFILKPFDPKNLYDKLSRYQQQ